MRMTMLLRYQAVLVRRRNRAQKLYRAQDNGPMNLGRVRLDSEVETLDKVLDDLDRLVKRNQDRWHDRRKR